MEVVDVQRVKEWLVTLGFCAGFLCVVGLIVALLIAGVASIFTAIAFGRWALWGLGVGAVIGLILTIWTESDRKVAVTMTMATKTPR